MTPKIFAKENAACNVPKNDQKSVGKTFFEQKLCTTFRFWLRMSDGPKMFGKMTSTVITRKLTKVGWPNAFWKWMDRTSPFDPKLRRLIGPFLKKMFRLWSTKKTKMQSYKGQIVPIMFKRIMPHTSHHQIIKVEGPTVAKKDNITPAPKSQWFKWPQDVGKTCSPNNQSRMGPMHAKTPRVKWSLFCLWRKPRGRLGPIFKIKGPRMPRSSPPPPPVPARSWRLGHLWRGGGEGRTRGTNAHFTTHHLSLAGPINTPIPTRTTLGVVGCGWGLGGLSPTPTPPNSREGAPPPPPSDIGWSVVRAFAWGGWGWGRGRLLLLCCPGFTPLSPVPLPLLHHPPLVFWTSLVKRTSGNLVQDDAGGQRVWCHHCAGWDGPALNFGRGGRRGSKLYFSKMGP